MNSDLGAKIAKGGYFDLVVAGELYITYLDNFIIYPTTYCFALESNIYTVLSLSLKENCYQSKQAKKEFVASGCGLSRQ